MKDSSNFRIDPVKFKHILTIRKLSQKALARAVGCKESEISRYVTGKGYASAPKLARLKAIVKVLECRIDDLITMPENPKPAVSEVDEKIVRIGICYNEFGIERITVDERLYWQTDNPSITGVIYKSLYLEMPHILAKYTAMALEKGLKQIQGIRMQDKLS